MPTPTGTAEAQTGRTAARETQEQASRDDVVSARESVRTKLLRDLLRGRIKPLPTERDPLHESDVMKRYGQNSRMPVRMALAMLAGEGLLRQRARYGYWLVDYDLDDVEQILRMRGGVEGMVAATLCQRLGASGDTDATPLPPGRLGLWHSAEKVYREMAEIVEQAEATGVDAKLEAKFADLDTEMHVQLARASGHDMAARHIVEWRSQMRIFMLQNEIPYYADALPDIHEEHRLIFGAIANLDSRSAGAAARAHIENALNRSRSLAQDPVIHLSGSLAYEPGPVEPSRDLQSHAN